MNLNLNHWTVQVMLPVADGGGGFVFYDGPSRLKAYLVGLWCRLRYPDLRVEVY